MKTLIVKNLPSALSTDAVDALLKHYGAISVRRMPDGGESKSRVFADFIDLVKFERAKIRLNSLTLADHKIHAEETIGQSLSNTDNTSVKIIPSMIDHLSHESTINLEAPICRPVELNQVPIAPALGLNYSSSPLLEYKYPKATPRILNNIANAMLAVPRLYTQVLHLMNKMNLPPPFDMKTAPLLLIEESKTIPDLNKRKDEVLSSDESEYDSTTSGGGDKKKIRYSKTVPHHVISKEELEQMRHPDLENDKIFSGYNRGEKSHVLYVKNIAKTVEEEDLRYIFGFGLSSKEEIDGLHIKLLTQGRMKGQAFITYPAANLAEMALEKTHGILLDGKYISVEYKR